MTKLSKHITKCAALKKAHNCTSNNYANYDHACWHVSVCRPTQFTNSHTLLHCAVFHYKSCDHMSALWNRALWRTLRMQRLKGTSDIINASQTSENNCTAYVRHQNNWTCALTLAFTKCFKSFFLFFLLTQLTVMSVKPCRTLLAALSSLGVTWPSTWTVTWLLTAGPEKAWITFYNETRRCIKD